MKAEVQRSGHHCQKRAEGRRWVHIENSLVDDLEGLTKIFNMMQKAIGGSCRIIRRGTGDFHCCWRSEC